MGVFSKIAEGLKKTKEAIKRKLFEAFKMKDLDDAFFDELEEALLTSDVGVTATTNLIDRLRDEIYERKITKPDDARACFKELLIQ